MNDKLETKRQAHLSAAEKIAVRIAVKEYAAKEKERKAQRLAAQLSRNADRNRKIKLGGLVIVAGVDTWDEAEIVGALLYTSPAPAEQRAKWREAGIRVMQARSDARAAAKG